MTQAEAVAAPSLDELQAEAARLRQQVRRHFACSMFVDPPTAIGQLADDVIALLRFTDGRGGCAVVADFLAEAAKAVPR